MCNINHPKYSHEQLQPIKWGITIKCNQTNEKRGRAGWVTQLEWNKDKESWQAVPYCQPHKESNTNEIPHLFLSLNYSV